MNDKAKSRAERIRDAQSRAEHAMTELLYAAERYREDSQSADDRMWRRRDVLRTARAYGRAIDRLTTVRR